MKKVALLVDGGYLRSLARLAGYPFVPDSIERIAHACVTHGEELYRVLYYDCAPFAGATRLPVSGKPYQFQGSDAWLNDLAARELFAVRRGVLKFRGWKPRSTPIAAASLQDKDFSPDFEQKGVDMRIGLDISSLAHDRIVERAILVTADTDMIPAMKLGRRAGLQIVAIELPGSKLVREFLAHVDLRRPVAWPAPSS